MKKVTIDWGEIELAFDNSSWEMDYYLDTETGQTLMVMAESRRYLEEIYEEYFAPDAPDDFNLDAALAQVDLPDWQKEAVREADLVERYYGSRIVGIPRVESWEAYDEMQDFIATIPNDRLYNKLVNATQGRGAFGRFRDILARHPAEEQRWYDFQQNRLRQRILEWLEMEEIEPINAPPAAASTAERQEELLSLRHKLLDETLIFTQAASRIPGVTRIALIGSLTTDKIDPKDADLLVTVTDDMDLTDLATAARKLQGHCQSFNRGGEVFLADEQHHYLGRACPWKLCGPGIRASCDALHCGKRPYLHDDLQAVKLSKALIAEPPLELWPQVTARVPVPDDVAERVLRPLRGE
ncbi:MAG TPA: hypothetical protein EYP41_00095 [Anaerolineae bacterium]|nr:hypothetical protein [Anaerolineae bacterium]